ncbi:SAM-dependent methyltransferase [Hansschlegelia plantiphila]|nr:cyclopropane-fatty-acyl-phospholipid synthase family protein [Hansschlegelia plantiphila]
MESLLRRLFGRIVQRGDLLVTSASGERWRFGDGSGQRVAIRFTDRRAQWGILLAPDKKLGELFMDGRLIVEQGDIYAFLDLVLGQLHGQRDPLIIRIIERGRMLYRRIAQANGQQRSRRNVAHHYDLDGGLYDLFLDSDRQYSCAYYEDGDATLEDAQLAKRRHIAAKLVMRPGDRVLDIGCGWGGLGLYLADVAGAAEVLGVTLSSEQLGIARRRAKDAGLDRQVSFELQDYRTLGGSFDRIVSVGMFEHVGVTNYRTFFETCRDRLSEDGVMLLHTIGLSDGPHSNNPWIEKYIFPGGALPALSELLPIIERSGLVLTDVEVLRLHYAFTLRDWRERFLARRDEALALYDERFCRMWEFYLAACEVAFRHRNVVVFQLQLARRQEAVPLTRGYIAEMEEALKRAERRDSQSAVAAE